MKLKVFLAATSFVFSCGALAEGHAHWEYQGKHGAAHWAAIDEAFKSCSLGLQQSPINIETRIAEKSDLKPIGFGYKPGKAEVINNGHTIQVNLPDAGAADIAGMEYKLLQFHFHTPSEEKVNGKAYPLVAHLVHKNADGKLAVVAVLFKLGKANGALKDFFAHLPVKEGDTYSLDDGFNPTEILPADQKYYAFMGSLTTPPCSEEVHWQVLKAPVELSSKQLAAFKKLYKMNARPIQALHGRRVQVS